MKTKFFIQPLGIYISTLKRRAQSSPSASVTIMTGLPPATLRARSSTSASSSPGAHRDHLTLPSRLLRSERNKCPVFRVSASRQVETTHNASPFLHNLNACHISPLSNALQQQSLLILYKQTLLPEKPGGLSYVIVRRVPSLSL